MKIGVFFYRTLSSQSSASLSASYLAAHLRKAGHTVDLVLLETKSSAHDIQISQVAVYDIIFYKPNFKDVPKLHSNLTTIRQSHLKPIVCLFGPFAVLNHKWIYDSYPWLHGILLQGHEACANQFVNNITNGRVEGSQNGFLLSGQDRIEDRTLTAEYMSKTFREVWPVRDIELNEPIMFANLEASRGCLRSCTFCHIPSAVKIKQDGVVRREVSDVIAEMIWLYSKGKRYLIFNDPIFVGGGIEGRQWLEAFVAKLQSMKCNLFFMAYLTLNDIAGNKGLIELLASVGLIRLFIGIESASKETIKNFRKGIDPHMYLQIKPWLLERSIVPHIGFMLFHPFVRSEELTAGIRFLGEADELHRFGVIYEPTRLIPGTVLMNQVSNAGLRMTNAERDGAPRYIFSGSVGIVRSCFERSIERIGLAVLERLEHLFVSSEFLYNLCRKMNLADEGVVERYQYIREARRSFSSLMRQLFSCSMAHQSASDDLCKNAQSLWNHTEEQVLSLYVACEAAGLEHPLEWIPMGNLLSEEHRPADYDGRSFRTRSGVIGNSR